MKPNNIIVKCIRHIKWMFSSMFGYFRFKKIINNSTFVFISHNGDSAGGAPVVLFELMKTLKGEQMVFLCEKPGKIIGQCKDENIPAFCTYLFQHRYLSAIINVQVKTIVVNTFAAYMSILFLNKKKIKIPVLWWIHEERGLIERYRSYVPKTLNNNIRILCVSHRVEMDLLELCPQYNNRTDIFYYGCRDLFEKIPEYFPRQENFRISVIGRICKRKNQMQVIEAYNCLDKSYQAHIYVDFVAASYDEDYKKIFDAAISGNSHFSYRGPIQREDMPKIYKDSNLIICASIDDPLPVVVTEAMMFMCPVIASSGTGQFSIIKNGINGFSYDVTSLSQLCQAIQMVYDAADLVDVMKKERETYLQYFSTEAVNINFKKLLLLNGVIRND
mgnify:CR=1 FL=1